MAKIKCYVDLKTNEEIVFKNKCFDGIKNGNKISYQENNIIVTILLKDNKIIMERKSDTYKIVLEFIDNQKTTGKYFVNNENLWLPLNIFTDKILFDDLILEIDYRLVDDNNSKFFFKIKYEVIK